MNQLESAFQKFGFSDNDVIEISKSFVLNRYKKGELFIKNDALADYLGFVEKGMFRFYFDKDAEEITTYIALENDFILSVQSFFANQTAKDNIKALVDSEVWIIKKSDFVELNNKIMGFKDFYISVLERLLVCLDESRFSYIALTPEERYAKLLKEKPEFVLQVPLKYLSALIGVTPRHLSRLRNNI
jgi:signal-transduction protein with cAMP-binding, CBS, and nucleotidyltransferase domain